MRIALSVVFAFLVLVLATCSFFAYHSKKSIGKSVAFLVLSLIPPVIGNLFIISSPIEQLSLAGCYIYFLGMNFVMFALINFTYTYCNIKPKYNWMRYVAYGFLIADSIQLLINNFTGHAFGMTQIEAFGSVYFQFDPYVGQTIHRVIDYVILGVVLLIFLYHSIRQPRVYKERYVVILLAMLVFGGWQTFYIFSETPVDASMIGFGVFGVLVFLLSIYYRPLRLLDRMLATIASKMPEAIYFFDTNGRCIWANSRGIELLGQVNTLDDVPSLLKEKIGDYDTKADDFTDNVSTGSGDQIVSYVIEKHNIIDDRKRNVGSYMSIRDNSKEQITLQKETYNATHDALTKVYNRAGYDSIMETVDISKCFLILFDADSFKETNDKYGHQIGDKVLIKIVATIKKHFREEDLLCRIGGDEFAIVLNDANEDTAKAVKKKIAQINNELAKVDDGLPAASISSGGAYGKTSENILELFNDADHALYETKFNGKRGFTLFAKR